MAPSKSVKTLVAFVLPESGEESDLLSSPTSYLPPAHTSERGSFKDHWKTCRDLFNWCLDATDDCSEKQELENQYGRFNIWAAHYGVRGQGPASLDHRLRDEDDIRQLVNDQLQRLQESLRQWHTFFETPPDEAPGLDELDDGGSQTEAEISLSDMSATENSGSEAEEDGWRFQCDDPVFPIRDAVNKLHRLGFAVRRTSLTSRASKASGWREYDENGIEKTNAFREFTYKRLEFKHKTISPIILERLSEANAFRRRRIRYLQEHQRKLQNQRKGSDPAQLYAIKHGEIKATPSCSSTMRWNSEPIIENNAQYEVAKSKTSAQVTVTNATELNRNEFRYAPSSVRSLAKSITPTDMALDPSEFPPLPKINDGASEFYCPFCCLYLPNHDRIQVGERGLKKWRQHVLTDLEPYVCLFEGCTDVVQYFPTKEQWIGHMNSHTKSWHCNLAGHQAHIFEAEQEYDKHMQICHTNLTSPMIALLKRQSVRDGALEFNKCPLCGPSCHFFPHNEGGNEHASIFRYQNFLGHLAKELQSIALWALEQPSEQVGSIASDHSDARRPAESTMSDSENASLDFSRLEREDDAWNWDEETAAGQNEEEPDEWTYIVETVCTIGKKKPYEGHENDPVLSSFIRRVHVEALLVAGKTTDPKLPCYFIPQRRNKEFFGRQGILDILERALCPTKCGQSMTAAALYGAGGIGKTQIAAEFAWNHQNKFDAVFWLHADKATKLASNVTRSAIRLELIAEGSAEANDHNLARDLFKAWLANPVKSFEDPVSEKARWLIIFDHVIDPKILEDYWPVRSASGSILVTRRNQMDCTYADFKNTLVNELTPRDSAEFLKQQLNILDEQKDISLTLGKDANYSPQQLVFLASMIKQKKYTLESFEAASKQGAGREAIRRLELQDSFRPPENSYISSVALGSLEPRSKALLDVLSVLDPDEIPERCLVSPPHNSLVENFPRTEAEYLEARNELIKFSFIFRNKTNGHLSIHRVAQEITRRTMSKPYFWHVFTSAVFLISKGWPWQKFTWRHSIARWPRCEVLLAHIVRLKEFAMSIQEIGPDIESVYQFARLCVDAGWYCHERGAPMETSVFCDVADRWCAIVDQMIAESEDVGNDIKLRLFDLKAENHHNRGTIASSMNLGEQAQKEQQIFNDMVKERVGDDPGDDMRLGISYNQLGVAHLLQNHLEQAEHCFNQSISSLKETKDFEDFKKSLPLANLASVYQMKGLYLKAEEKLLEGLAGRQAAFGIDDRESFITGRFYYSLGNVKWIQGSFGESFDFHKKAYEHYKLTLGRGHHRTADAAVALAIHFSKLEQNKDALDHFQAALRIYGDRALYAPEKARALWKRYMLFIQLGQMADAAKDAEECLRLHRQFNPHDTRPLDALCDEDFYSRIVFWSR